MESFLINAILAGIGVALVVGPLGCFVVWRKMSYFGDSLAHSALLGIALGLASGIGATWGTLLICLLFAALLVFLQSKKILATDTLLGILAHAALSIGIITMSLLGNPRFDLYAYLFGDILTVTKDELLWIYSGGAVVLAILIRYWSELVLVTLQEEIARAEGIKHTTGQFLLIVMMTIVVAIAIRIVGILLITSMLIIPAATARHIARSPEAMAVYASLLGVSSVILGTYLSLHFDTPSGPTIVATAALCFMLILPLATLTQYMNKRSASSPLKS